MITYDVVSDLYITDSTGFSWDGKATSLYCIIAGNISANRDVLFEVLVEVAKNYEAVFFIDGDLEHTTFKDDLNESYEDLHSRLSKIENVAYLNENIIVMNNTIILGVNAWTTFDFTGHSESTDVMQFLIDREQSNESYINEVFKLAISDQHYLYNSITYAQSLSQVDNIILVSNAVPVSKFIEHNFDYGGTSLGDITGNSGIHQSLNSDTENKVTHWIFGRFIEEVDYTIDGITYMSNPRSSMPFDQYYPKRISI